MVSYSIGSVIKTTENLITIAINFIIINSVVGSLFFFFTSSQVYCLGTILSMQISFVGFQPVQSSEHMAVSLCIASCKQKAWRFNSHWCRGQEVNWHEVACCRPWESLVCARSTPLWTMCAPSWQGSSLRYCSAPWCCSLEWGSWRLLEWLLLLEVSLQVLWTVCG